MNIAPHSTRAQAGVSFFSRAGVCVAAALLCGCGTTYVSDAKRAKGEATPDAAEQILQESVFFEVNPAMASVTPQCIHVLPFEDPKNQDINAHFRKAFHAQLSVTGVRLVPLQAIRQASAEQIAKAQGCDFALRGEITENSRLFLGVYSEYRAGATVRLIHLPSGEAYWSASHTMVKRSGGIPIGIISSIAGAASAVKNLESDQAVRVSYELAYRMVRSIPNLQYFEPQDSALASVDPSLVDPKAASQAATPAPTPPTDQERLQKALQSDDHAAVLALVEAMQAKGDKTAALFSLRGRAHQGLGEHEKASADFIAAIAMGEAADSTYISLGKSYAALGRFDFAAAAFDKAAAINEKNTDALMLGGLAHSANGDEDTA
ncbi:MAG: hypothetical protein ACO3DD_10785, partial [Burkholderiaceae bacterium]